jgi:hypothetical protein
MIRRLIASQHLRCCQWALLRGEAAAVAAVAAVDEDGAAVALSSQALSPLVSPSAAQHGISSSSSRCFSSSSSSSSSRTRGAPSAAAPGLFGIARLQLPDDFVQWGREAIERCEGGRWRGWEKRFCVWLWQ